MPHHPIETVLQMQLAAYAGWSKMLQESFAAYERLLQHQAKMFAHPPYIRLQNVIPNGASWFDHYGNRAHDVNVEKV